MTESPQKFFPVSWEELHRHGKALAWRLIDKGVEGHYRHHARRSGTRGHRRARA